MKAVLKNMIYVLGALMILIAAKDGMMSAIDKINVALLEITNGLVLDCVPLGSEYHCGLSGMIAGYVQLIILIGCVSAMMAGLIALAIFFIKTEVDICCSLLQKQQIKPKGVSIMKK